MTFKSRKKGKGREEEGVGKGRRQAGTLSPSAHLILSTALGSEKQNVDQVTLKTVQL